MSQVPFLVPVAEQVPVGVDGVLKPRLRNRGQQRLTISDDENRRPAGIEDRRRLEGQPLHLGDGRVGRNVAQDDVQRHIVRAMLCRRANDRIELFSPAGLRDRKTRHGYLEILDRDDTQFEVRVRIRRKLGYAVHGLVLTSRRDLHSNTTLDRGEFRPRIDLRRMHNHGTRIADQPARKFDAAGTCRLIVSNVLLTVRQSHRRRHSQNDS